MAQGNPYARMIKMMQRKGADLNGYDMTTAKVIGINPLVIAVNGQVIENHIFCDGLLTSDKEEELRDILAGEEYLSQAFKQFLIDLYNEIRVKPEEKLLVQRVGNSFYVCGKAAGNE